MVQLPKQLTQSMGDKKEGSRDWSAIILYGFVGLQILMALLVFLTHLRVSQIVTTQRPTLVELQDGSAVRVKMKATHSREAATLDNFVREIFTLGMNWTGELPDGEDDPGVPVGDGGIVPTPMWSMSQVMESQFKRGWLSGMAEGLDPRPVLSGKEQRILKIRDVSPPVEVSPGQWTIDIISDWQVFTPGDRRGLAIAFNKRVHLLAVPPPVSPLGDEASALERAIYKVQSAGLEIQDIEEIPNG